MLPDSFRDERRDGYSNGWHGQAKRRHAIVASHSGIRSRRAWEWCVRDAPCSLAPLPIIAGGGQSTNLPGNASSIDRIPKAKMAPSPETSVTARRKETVHEIA